MATISRLALGALLGLSSSCALDDTSGAGDPSAPLASDDPVADGEPATADSVCTTGHYRCHAVARTNRAGQRISSRAAPLGYGPADLQSAYRIDPAITPAARPVVAIVDAYGYSALESDLATYRAQFGLPPCTIASGCLKVVNQAGQPSPLPPEPPTTDDWTLETALDLDMASAACPRCNLLVVQATDNAGDGLFIAQNAAARLGATVISNSWGGPEQADVPPEVVTMTEAYFDHPGVATFVSAGDLGFNDGNQGPDYPATSAHAIAVGGTRLIRDASARGWAETAWSKGGSACSLWIAKPAYQTVSPCTKKATADIAAVGDPATGVAVYNTRAGGWTVVGGTSAAAPFIAAIFAGTGNGAQTSGAFLAGNAGKLNDVLTGRNGTCTAMPLLCNAAAGWDGPTGYGTPNALALVPPELLPGPGSDGSAGGPDGESSDVSGGCSTGGGAGAGMLVALFALARRRR